MATDPRAPQLAKIVQPEEIREKTGMGCGLDGQSVLQRYSLPERFKGLSLQTLPALSHEQLTSLDVYVPFRFDIFALFTLPWIRQATAMLLRLKFLFHAVTAGLQCHVNGSVPSEIKHVVAHAMGAMQEKS